MVHVYDLLYSKEFTGKKYQKKLIIYDQMITEETPAYMWGLVDMINVKQNLVVKLHACM